MKKTAKFCLLIVSVLLILGLLAFAWVMTKYNWDFTKLNTVKYQTNTYGITESFNNIHLETDTADIVFAPTTDDKCSIICYEETKAPHSATVLDNTLSIKTVNKKSWYDYININFSSPKITIYLPEAQYAALLISESTGDIEVPKDFNFDKVDISLSTGDVDFSGVSKSLKIKTNTGDVSVKSTSVEKLDLKASTGAISVSGTACSGDTNLNISTGKTTLTDFKCKNLTSNGTTGDIYLSRVIATEKISITRDTGNVKFEGSDASEILVETDTGDIQGNLLTEKVFIATSDTGRVDTPKTITGGKCELSTDTGNIKITIK